MSRKFIATVLAAAMALSGITAAPARAADNDALLRTLGIGTTLLIVGAAIKNARDDDDDRKKKSRYEERDQRPIYGDNDRWKDRGRHHDRGWQDHRGRPQFGRGRAPLPSSCLIQTRGGAQLFGARCLQQRYEQSRRLPDTCRSAVRTRYGTQAAYDARCLRRDGYDVARR